MIARDEQLTDFVGKLQAAPWVAMDTEADSLHAYPEKICLLQISIPERDAIVDPLAGINLAPLWETLRPRELLMHGCDYDLRLLRRTYGFSPAAVFDTMLAARLLGHTAFGLGNLVERHLGIHLEKGPQKANWGLRPLPPRMEDYARNDSRHLNPLASLLRAELERLGRLEWHREMCARLLEQSTADVEPDPDTLWRVKGSGYLDRRGLAILRAAWHWREHEAIAANRPPFFIFPTDALVALAQLAAAGQDFNHLLPRRFSPTRRERLHHAVQKAQRLPLEKCPQLTPRRPSLRLNAHQRKLMGELLQRRDAHASQLQLDPTLIASRATLIALATDGEDARRSLMRWQAQLLF